MIRSINVVCGSRDEILAKLPPSAVLIAIRTPGRDLALPPAMHRVLRLEFDTLAAELEAASLRRVDSSAAQPFAPEHALRIVALLEAVAASAAAHDVYLCESEGLSRSVTIARWAAAHCGLADTAAAAVPDGVASCPLMLDLLDRCAVPGDAAGGVMPAALPLPRPHRSYEATWMGELR